MKQTEQVCVRRSSSDHTSEAARSLLRSGAGGRYGSELERQLLSTGQADRQTDNILLHRPYYKWAASIKLMPSGVNKDDLSHKNDEL